MALSAYDLNFSRFGVGEGTLGAVAGGVYDVTTPAFMGLRGAGAARGGVDESAIALMRSIPALLGGVPDQMVGPVARSRGLTNLLPLETIIRLRSHPEEIEARIKRYQQDRKSLDIGKDAAEKWASFNAAVERAGQATPETTSRRAVMGAVLAAGAASATLALPAVASGAPMLSAVDRRVIDLWSRYTRARAALKHLANRMDAAEAQMPEWARAGSRYVVCAGGSCCKSMYRLAYGSGERSATKAAIRRIFSALSRVLKRR